MSRLTYNNKSLKKGEGLYISYGMFLSSLILIYLALKNFTANSPPYLFYQNISFGIVFFANALFLRITKKLNISINLGLGSLFLLCTLLLFKGSDSPPALIWVTLIPLCVFYSKGTIFSIVYSVSFFMILIIVVLLQYVNLVDTPFSSSAFLQVIAVYSVISTFSYAYKDVISNREERIYHELYFCSLTGLPNRNRLIYDLNKIKGTPLILINIDDFKIVNSLYGTSNGDKILLELSLRLKNLYSCNIIYKIYKLHADEFAIVLQPFTDQDSTRVLIEELIPEVSKKYSINKIDIALSISIGVSNSSRDLLANADIALKTAKEGRKAFAFYNGKYKVTQKYELNIQKLLQLKKAVLDDNIIPFFQPIICNTDNSIHKYECLARLKNEDCIILPSHFLDISKKAKIYPEITRSMIKKSFDMFRNKNFEFSLNIDIDDILNKETTQLIYDNLNDPDVAKNVVFELLETEKLDDNEEVFAFISNVKKMGAKIAIDDFGSGYSNFEYILKLNVDFIKIDASLIKNIVNDRNSRILTETIVKFSKKLNLKTIAEFVHSEDVRIKVKELGIDYSQGFHIGKPVESV